jgi:hypothetical protein
MNSYNGYRLSAQTIAHEENAIRRAMPKPLVSKLLDNWEEDPSCAYIVSNAA